MLRNSWGMKPAGSICSLAMHLIVEMYRNEFPHLHDFIKKHLYIDDGTFSVDTVEEAVKLAKDTCFVMSQGGFTMKHFIIGGVHHEISNHQKSDLPEQVRCGGQVENILGLVWKPDDDLIGYKCRVNFSKNVRGRGLALIMQNKIMMHYFRKI